MIARRVHYLIIFAIPCALVVMVYNADFVALLLRMAHDHANIPTGLSSEEVTPTYFHRNTFHECEVMTRLERIQKICLERSLNGHIEKDELGFLMSNDEHKVLYCPIFKVGSTTFRGLVFDDGQSKISPNNWSLRPMRDRYWHARSVKEAHDRLNNYFKFLVVRHPFDRLYSSFKSKFHLDEDRYVAKKLTKLMLSKLGNALKLDGNGTALPTLDQFLFMVATEPKRFNNPHWDDYVSYCHPCSIQYDHVIYMETLEDDYQIVLDHFTDANGTKPSLPLYNVRRDNQDRLKETSEAFTKINTKVIGKLFAHV